MGSVDVADGGTVEVGQAAARLPGLGGGRLQRLAELDDFLGDLLGGNRPVRDPDALGVEDQGRPDGDAG